MLSPEGCKTRLGRFAEIVGRRGLDLALVSEPKHLYYLAGVPVSPVPRPLLLMVRPGSEALLLAGSENAAGACFDGEVVVHPGYDLDHRMLTFAEEAVPPLEDALAAKDGSVGRIGTEARHLPLIYRTMLSRLYPDAVLDDVSTVIPEMRWVKDEDELALIRRSESLVALGYRVAKEEMEEGRTEVEIYGAGLAACAKEVGGPVFFGGDFVSGERSLGIGGPPTDRALKNGETLILDLWAEFEGYWADTCRTFVVGRKPSAEQIRVHDVLMRATDAGRAKLRPGVRANEVYRAVFDLIAAEGWGAAFPHHAGHGIGLDGQEAPFFIPGCDHVLEEGMICTLEPGVYRPEAGGIRAEDNYRITASDPEVLTEFPHGL